MKLIADMNNSTKSSKLQHEGATFINYINHNAYLEDVLFKSFVQKFKGFRYDSLPKKNITEI